MLITFTITLIISNIKLFADDTTLLYCNSNPIIAHRILSEDLNQIDLWAKNGL